MKKLLFLILIVLGCSRDPRYCYICHIYERYVDEHNKVLNDYKYSIRVPDQTPEYILKLEDANTYIIDEERGVGAYFDCNKCK